VDRSHGRFRDAKPPTHLKPNPHWLYLYCQRSRFFCILPQSQSSELSPESASDGFPKNQYALPKPKFACGPAAVHQAPVSMRFNDPVAVNPFHILGTNNVET
jgi:hypothetical protein